MRLGLFLVAIGLFCRPDGAVDERLVASVHLSVGLLEEEHLRCGGGGGGGGGKEGGGGGRGGGESLIEDLVVVPLRGRELNRISEEVSL